MGKIQKPLNRDAVSQADTALYERHARDPRPNALYAADGTRLPLDATDPDQAALRSEWRQLYLDARQPQQDTRTAAASKPAAPGAGAPPDAATSDRSVGEPVQSCPNTHDISLKLEPTPDAATRPGWWPSRPPGYGGTAYSAEITNGHHEGALDAQGVAQFEGIPCGNCSFTFVTFYDDVRTALTPT